jgi:hypothetical protein
MRFGLTSLGCSDQGSVRCQPWKHVHEMVSLPQCHGDDIIEDKTLTLEIAGPTTATSVTCTGLSTNQDLRGTQCPSFTVGIPTTRSTVSLTVARMAQQPSILQSLSWNVLDRATKIRTGKRQRSGTRIRSSTPRQCLKML